jgi:hypothetical protein
MSEETRKNIIEKVAKAILNDRQYIYGSPEDSFQRISMYWSLYLGIAIRPDQVADMMELLKVARRQDQPFHLDNYIDSAGYAILAGELASMQKVEG